MTYGGVFVPEIGSVSLKQIRVPTGQGRLEKVSEFELSGESQGEIFFLEKSGKIGATRCQIFRLKCIKFDFHWGCASDPVGGA